MGFLNYSFRMQRSNRANADFQAAQELMQRGSYEEAIERYRDALSSSHSVDYRLALGLALVKAGHASEAPIYLNEVLREKPGNASGQSGSGARGGAGRPHRRRRVAHYQRAIYGNWPGNALR